MLINLSNHPSAKWDTNQKQTAERLYGQIVDLPFPAIDPKASSGEVENQAGVYFQQVMQMFNAQNNDNNPRAVHIQGEFTFVCKMVGLLKPAGIVCVASTTTRNVIEKEDGEKTVKFNFVQFREY